MKRIRTTGAFVMILLLVILTAAPVFADTGGYEDCSVTYDKEYVYIKATAPTNGPWDMGMPYDSVRFSENGNSAEIVLPYVSGTASFEPRYKNGYGIIQDASGNSVYSEGTAKWEIKIPLAALWTGAAGEGIHVGWSWRGGNVSLAGVPADGSGQGNGNGDNGNGNGNGQPGDGGQGSGGGGEHPGAGGSGIQIDGYYDDWEGIPKTPLSWGDNNGETFHKGAMIRDGKYIYVYLETHEKYYSQIPLSNMVFTVAGHNARMYLNFVNQEGTGPDWSRSGELYNLSHGTHLGLAPFADYPVYPRGTAAVTIAHTSKTGGDRLEFAVSIHELALIANVDDSQITNGGEVTLYVSDLGPQKLTIVGTSTGTYIGILIAVSAVASTFAYRKYRRRKNAL